MFQMRPTSSTSSTGRQRLPLRPHFISSHISHQQQTLSSSSRTRKYTFEASQNDNNPCILKFSALQESEDRGGTRTHGSLSLVRGGKARWVQTSPSASAIVKTTQKVLPPHGQQHYNNSTRNDFLYGPYTHTQEDLLVSPTHFLAPTKWGVCLNKRKKVGDTM